MIHTIIEIVNNYLLPGVFIYSAFVLLVNLLFTITLFGKTTIDIPIWRFFRPQSRFNIMNYLTI